MKGKLRLSKPSESGLIAAAICGLIAGVSMLRRRRGNGGVALWVLLLAWAATMAGRADMIVNGTFEAGNTGFMSQYAYSPGYIWPEGVYDVLEDPNQAHPLAASFGDHTTGSGLMLAVNGSTTPNLVFWEQTLAVLPDTPYDFSLWYANWDPVPGDALPVFRVEFSSAQMPELLVTSPAGTWENAVFHWDSGSASSVVVRLISTGSEVGGNDFAVDDISMTAVPEPAEGGLIAGALCALAVGYQLVRNWRRTAERQPSA